ncbi:phytase [Microbulbifer sp. 2205BS26-8]|uniref:phytase n=1 Tax=Microbulbifer sp. 2205BS26-8 TaxID=3064386 RepID=UPI00273E4FF3|nr:phytase [Microbulbifer sp. 2205BS26-8]MDP5208590.1 phytase [Microbulbifer sp. 2205BS26-8]
MKRTCFCTAGILLSALLSGCDGTPETPLQGEKKLPRQEIALGAIEAEQMVPVRLDGRQRLLLASERRGLLLLDGRGDTLAAQAGSLEQLAAQEQADGSVLVAAYSDAQAQIRLYRIRQPSPGEGPEIQYLGGRSDLPPQGALCFSRQNNHTHLFAIGEDGLGHEYLIKPGAREWKLIEVRPLYFGEQVNACAVDMVTQRLLVSQPPLGVITLNADAEKDEERKFLITAAQLGEEFGGLWVEPAGSHVWLAAGDQLQRYALQAAQGGPQWRLRIAQPHNPISPALLDGSLLTLDSDRDALLYFDVSPPLSGLREAPSETSAAVARIPARAQTQPVVSAGDAADDPAIWVNPEAPENSLIFGTDKKRGLNVYDLSGGLVQHFAVGRVNNVDIRPIRHPRYRALAAASNRSTPGVDLFAIGRDGQVEHLGLRTVTLQDPYGLCLYRDGNDLLAWVSDKAGALHQMKIQVPDAGRNWQLHEIAQLEVGSQVEGCVVDDENARLFFGEEDLGVWRLDLGAFDAGGAPPQLVAEADGEHLVADVEGLGLYRAGDSGYLVVSSQGNDSYALYSRDGSAFIGNFRLGLNLHAGVDASSETDGLAVTSANLGAEYPQGLLVVQDGRNRMPDAAQNFKLVSWQDIRKALELPDSEH